MEKNGVAQMFWKVSAAKLVAYMVVKVDGASPKFGGDL